MKPMSSLVPRPSAPRPFGKLEREKWNFSLSNFPKGRGAEGLGTRLANVVSGLTTWDRTGNIHNYSVFVALFNLVSATYYESRGLISP